MAFFRSRNEYGSGGGSEVAEGTVPSSMSVAMAMAMGVSWVVLVFVCLYGVVGSGGGWMDIRLTSELHDRGTIPLHPAGIATVVLRAAVRMIAEQLNKTRRKLTESETR